MPGPAFFCPLTTDQVLSFLLAKTSQENIVNSVEARHWLIVQCLSDNTLQLLFLSFDQSQKLVKSILLSLKYHSDIINNHRIT